MIDGEISADSMTIGEFARAAAVNVETVRFYQRRGLLPVPARGAGPRRYDERDLARLRFVRSAQRAGFPLAEIGQLLQFDSTDDRTSAHALALRRIAALDDTIASLQRSRNALHELARCCSGGGDGPCPILRAFEAGRP